MFSLKLNDIASIDYFFKTSDSQMLFLLPNQPSAVTVSQNTSHEHFYSIDGTPISRRSDKVHWKIVIEGFSGVSKRNFLLQTPANTKKLSSIKEILENFETFLAKYREDGQRFDFMDLLKGKEYVDSFPTTFTYMQSVEDSRLGYKWQIELMCYSEVKKQFKTTIK